MAQMQADSQQSRIAIRPLSPVIGAEITGLDLAQPLSPDLLATLNAAFVEHQILCFRDQHLTKDQMRAFTRHWGSLGEHLWHDKDTGRREDVITFTNATPDGKPNGKHTDASAKRWHTDRSFMVRPALATFLYALTVPEEGGDTLFANTANAYDALPEAMKQRIAPLKAIHSIEYSHKQGTGEDAGAEEVSRAPPVVHPLASSHPVSGRKTLYCGAHAWKIAGMPEAEGRALLDEITARATEPRFVYSHKWRPNDLMMWDNRSVLHAATDFRRRTVSAPPLADHRRRRPHRLRPH